MRLSTAGSRTRRVWAVEPLEFDGAAPPLAYEARPIVTPSARAVAGPTTPSAFRPRLRWKRLTAAAVWRP
jgi:hypothetical protein